MLFQFLSAPFTSVISVLSNMLIKPVCFQCFDVFFCFTSVSLSLVLIYLTKSKNWTVIVVYHWRPVLIFSDLFYFTHFLKSYKAILEMNLLHVYVKHSHNSVQCINAFFIQFELNTGFVYFHTMATCATNAASFSTQNKGNRRVFLHYAFITKKNYMRIKPTTRED